MTLTNNTRGRGGGRGNNNRARGQNHSNGNHGHHTYMNQQNGNYQNGHPQNGHHVQQTFQSQTPGFHPGAFGGQIPYQASHPSMQAPPPAPFVPLISPPRGPSTMMQPPGLEPHGHNGQRVVYTQMTPPLPAPGMNGAPYPPNGNGTPCWNNNGSQPGNSPPRGSPPNLAHGYFPEGQHGHGVPNNPMTPMEMVTISRVEFDNMNHELHYLRTVIFNFQNYGTPYAPYSANHYGPGQHQWQQPGFQHPPMSSRHSSGSRDRRKTNPSEEYAQHAAKENQSEPENTPLIIETEPSPHLDLSQIAIEAAEKTPGRSPSLSARRISYPLPTNKRSKFDGSNKASFNAIVEDSTRTRTPSPLPVVGIAKISPVPTYAQLHGGGKVRGTHSESKASDKESIEGKDSGEKEQFKEFVHQVEEVNDLVEKFAAKKSVTGKKMVSDNQQSLPKEQPGTTPKLIPAPANLDNISSPMLTDDGFSNVTAVCTVGTNDATNGDNASIRSISVSTETPKMDPKPFKFNPKASDFAANFFPSVDVPSINAGGESLQTGTEFEVTSLHVSQLAYPEGLDQYGDYGYMQRVQRGFPVFELNENGPPSDEAGVELPPIISIPFSSSTSDMPDTAKEVSPQLEDHVEPKKPGKFATGKAWADSSSEDEDLVDPKVSITKRHPIETEVELVLTSGGPVEAEHIGAASVEWIIKSDDESISSGVTSESEEEATLLAESPDVQPEKGLIGLGIPMVSVSHFDDQSKVTISKDEPTPRKTSNKSSASSKSFVTALESNTSGMNSPEFGSAVAHPSEFVQVGLSDMLMPKSPKKSPKDEDKKEQSPMQSPQSKEKKERSEKAEETSSTSPKVATLAPPTEEEWVTVAPKNRKKSATERKTASSKSSPLKMITSTPMFKTPKPHSDKATSEVGNASEDKETEMERRKRTYRKLYISGIPKTVTYESFVALIRGGLIDDIYISGLSPEFMRPSSQKNNDMTERDWFGYITFFSAKGSSRFIDYLISIDPSPKKGPYQGLVAAYMMIEGARLSVQLRDNDQREIAPDIIKSVQNDHATRILNFKFSRGIGRNVRRATTHPDAKINRSDGPIKWDWNVWKKALKANDAREALDRVRTQIQVWGSTPIIYVESIKLLSTPTAGDDSYNIQVSFLRISSAEKVKGHLDFHRDYSENCLISYAPDPCETRKVEITQSVLKKTTDKDATSTTDKEVAPKKSKKSKKRNPGNIEDKQLFPPLPGSPPKDAKPVSFWTASQKIKEAPPPPKVTPSKPKPAATTPKEKKILANKASTNPKNLKLEPKGSPTPSIDDESEFPTLASPTSKPFPKLRQKAVETAN